MYKTLGAHIAALRAKAGPNTVGLGVVGFFMGGHWAVWLSQRPQYYVEATVLYYAARAANPADGRSGLEPRVVLSAIMWPLPSIELKSTELFDHE
jgi:dienelactone hydrolase